MPFQIAPARRSLAVLAGVVAVWAVGVVRNFSGPIGDDFESFLAEYQSWLFGERAHLFPYPHAELTGDVVMYPFGTNFALQSFCVERDLFKTALESAFGFGPWLQLYAMLSVAITAFGLYALLRKDFGELRATLAATGATLFNFYAGLKFPSHLNLAIIHWSALGIAADFVLAQRAAAGRPLGARLLFVRGALLMLTFGLELGSHAGIGITSFLVTAVVVAAIAARRGVRVWTDDEAAKRPTRALVGLATLTVAAGWFYGCLVLSIVLQTRAFDWTGVATGTWWSQPVRLLIPYFGNLNPTASRFLVVMGDLSETGYPSGSAGVTLLLAAGWGVWRARKAWLGLLPALICLALFVLTRPGFNLLHWMPWFTHMRVLSRPTVAYAPLFSLLAVAAPFSLSKTMRAFAGGLCALACVELGTFLWLKHQAPAFSFGPDLFAAMKQIEQTPGDAILEFPPCVMGGNSPLGMCPFLKLQSVYALQRFHHKKELSHYIGRLHPSQAQLFLDQGWRRLFHPDNAMPIYAQKQMRCLSDEEWGFLSAYLEQGRFAGLEVALDVLPDGCAEQFFARFGAPTARYEIPVAGKLAFVPRRTPLPADASGARSLHFAPVPSGDDELVSADPPDAYDVSGLAPFEPAGSARWGIWPATVLEFEVPVPVRYELTAIGNSPHPRQSLTLVLDGEVLANTGQFEGNAEAKLEYVFNFSPGRHRLELRFAVANHHPAEFAHDERDLAVAWKQLRLHRLMSR